MSKSFLLFSGYNQRAVIAICRYFNQVNQKFFIVSSGPDDSIYLTKYKDNVVLARSDKILNIEMFEKISALGLGTLVYCPTSEFLNFFVLQNVDKLSALNIQPGMPSEEVYTDVTNKWSSQNLINRISRVFFPRTLSMDELTVPCVFKPYKNVNDAIVLYPQLCLTNEELQKKLLVINPAHYFVQEYIDGQSFYLCGYLSKTGAYASYWQENLLQQPEGKSIVLARTCANPGLDENEFFDALRSHGYYGPIMAEFILREGQLYYIEMNPRFWGPFQLAVDCCESLPRLFVMDWGGQAKEARQSNGNEHYYAWYFGAKLKNLRRYPGARNLPQIDVLLEKMDVYNRPDTVALHKLH